MKEKTETPVKKGTLRKKAGKKLKSQPEVKIEELSAQEAQRLIQELRIHQIELEMQNEELRRAHAELEESRTKYSDLYDFAPVGYFTLDSKGLILEANLTGASMLGIERGLLINRPFSQYILKEYQDKFFLHRKNVFDTKKRQTCEIRIIRKGGDEFYAQLESVSSRDYTGNRVCRSWISDISVHKQAEEASLKLLEELKSIYNNLPVGIVYLDSKFRILDSNRFFNDFTGFQGEELKGRLCYEIVGEYSDDPARKGPEKICSFCKKEECFKYKKPTVMERPLAGKYIRVTTIPEVNEKGEINRFMEIVEDITKDRLAMAEIESLSRFPSENPNPVLRISSGKKVLYKNEAFNFLLGENGLSEKDVFRILPENIGILIDESLKKEQRHELLEVTVGNRVFCYNLVPVAEKKYINLYGRDITARKRAETDLQKAKDGLERRVKERTEDLEKINVLLRQEITERKEVEKALKESELWLTNIFNSLEEGVLVISPDRVLMSVNKAAEKIFGYTKDELSEHSTEILHVDHAHYLQFGRKIDEAFSKGETAFFEFKVKNKSGEVFPSEHAVSLLKDDSGSPIGIVSVVRDITERKKAEEELKKAKEEIELWNRELEKRVKDKTDELVKSQAQLIQSEKLSVMGQMAGGLAHELNSPLAGLLPMLEAFRERSGKGSRDYEELSLMLKSANHMARVVKDFGIFSRKSKGLFSKLSLNEVIEDTLSFSSVKLRYKGIKIKKNLNEMLPLVRGDKTELQQVVLNMITNACDAMNEGGRFIIETSVSEDKKNVTMEFIDNGIGIEKENLDKIFDPFFTTKKEGEGIGLGLSVTYGIIVKHGGKISVESEPGKGTRFTIILPVITSA